MEKNSKQKKANEEFFKSKKIKAEKMEKDLKKIRKDNLIEVKDGFTAKVKEIQNRKGYRNPIMFGIARVDIGQLNPNKTLQATFLHANYNENNGSAAIFTEAIRTTGKCKVNCSKSEQVFDVNERTLAAAIAMFNPYIKEAKGGAHKNVQAVRNVFRVANKYFYSQVDEDSDDFYENDEILSISQTTTTDILEYLEDEDLSNFRYKIVFIYDDVAVESPEAAYLKLQTISNKKVKPRELNLNGAFGALENVAWHGNTPIELDWLRAHEIELKASGIYPAIDYVDKFPRYLMHVIPEDNTRILDTSKVRFGAHLAAGSTVMPGASYINFNAGTLGPVMVEGRISSSAIVGSGSNVGGGASILGVLSGTDGIPISIGENTLLGANSVTGISLGDACIVDAGAGILAGTKVNIAINELKKINEANENPITVHTKGRARSITITAISLNGMNGIHFRQDSVSGKITAKRSTREVKLNTELH